jgi:cytochrome c-type biogenesis protein CcmH
MLLGATAAWSQQPRADEDELRDLGAPQGQPLSGVQLEARAQEVGSLLRCPQCQGLSVADSPVDTAIAMQERVRRFVALGYTEEQILAYFESSYGEFIRLSPKPEGFNLVVWILPVLALLVGVGVIALRVRRTVAPAAAAGEDLEEYRRKVREAIGE